MTDTHKVLSVGIIAFGLSGRVFHAPFLIAHPSFNLVALYERGSKHLGAEYCESQGYVTRSGARVQTLRSVEELCSLDDIDLIVVCSPIEFHYEHAKIALSCGKHVLVEKAFCSTAQQARELLDFAKAKERICVPYHNRQFDSDFLTLKRLIKNGELGEIVEYNGYYNRWSPNLKGSWKDTVPGSGGNFRSLGSHMIDQAVALFGIPKAIWADIRCQRKNGRLDDAWEVHLFYDDPAGSLRESNLDADMGVHCGGFRAILKGSLLCRDHDIRYMVHGLNGSWIKKGVDPQESRLMMGVVPQYLTNDLKGAREFSDAHRPFCEDESLWGQLKKFDGSVVKTPPCIGSYQLLYDSIYDSIVNRAPAFIGEDNIIAVIELIELAYQSSKSGAVMSLIDRDDISKHCA